MSRQERRGCESSRETKVLFQRLPLAFFDVDGTLTEGFTIYSFAEFLTSRGMFRREFWNQMQADLSSYRGSDQSGESYHGFAIDLVNHYAQGLRGRGREETERQGELFFDEVQEGRVAGYKLVDYAEDLTGLMKNVGKTIAVSGSPLESLLPLKKRLSFDEIRATTLAVENGCFTGGVVLNLAIGLAKSRIVGEYSGRMDFDRSFAFGDSPHDLPILEAVANPFVLGNNQALRQIGEEREWFVATDGDGVMDRVRDRVSLLFEGGEE